MKTTIHGFSIIHQNNEEEKAIVDAIGHYYDQLQLMMRQRKDDRLILSVEVPMTDKVMLSALITKDIVFLRGVDQNYTFCKSCEFKDLALLTSLENEKLLNSVKNKNVQPRYSPEILQTFIHELAEQKKSDFIQNTVIWRKYQKTAEMLNNKYLQLTTNALTQKIHHAVETSQQQLRAAAFIRDNRNTVDKLAELDRMFRMDRKTRLSPDFARQEQILSDSLRSNIREFNDLEKKYGTPQEDIRRTIDKLYQGTGLEYTYPEGEERSIIVIKSDNPR